MADALLPLPSLRWRGGPAGRPLDGDGIGLPSCLSAGRRRPCRSRRSRSSSAWARRRPIRAIYRAGADRRADRSPLCRRARIPDARRHAVPACWRLGSLPSSWVRCLLLALPNQCSSALGRLILINMLVIFGPSNPQSYNPETFLDVSLFVSLAAALLLMAQALIPPLSDERRRHWMLGSARRELDRLPSRTVPRYGAGRGDVSRRRAHRPDRGVGRSRCAGHAVLKEALGLFDQAGLIRLREARLARLAGGPLAGPADQARKALAMRDVQAIRRAALALHDTAAKDALLAASHVMGLA